MLPKSGQRVTVQALAHRRKICKTAYRLSQLYTICSLVFTFYVQESAVLWIRIRLYFLMPIQIQIRIRIRILTQVLYVLENSKQ